MRKKILKSKKSKAAGAYKIFFTPKKQTNAEKIQAQRLRMQKIKIKIDMLRLLYYRNHLKPVNESLYFEKFNASINYRANFLKFSDDFFLI